jgi:hypothetical protein
MNEQLSTYITNLQSIFLYNYLNQYTNNLYLYYSQKIVYKALILQKIRNYLLILYHKQLIDLLEQLEHVSQYLGKKQKRYKKVCTACPHSKAMHYAKNMCVNCYRSKGRTKKPWKCPHSNKPLYALGMCQNCYQNHYLKLHNNNKRTDLNEFPISDNNSFDCVNNSMHS